MVTTFLVIFSFIIVALIFIRQPAFGKTPKGKRLKLIRQSPYFKNGKFQNLTVTPMLTEGASYSAVLSEFIFKRNSRRKPSEPLPAIKTDLINIDKDEDVLVWFGHSSYFMQLAGKTFLVDPVFSGAASPVKFTTRSFEGTDVYGSEDMPLIDYLIITHDHWDHLDYETIIGLKNKVSRVICGLGVGEHLAFWSFSIDKICELSWYQTVTIEEGFIIHATPSRHFSGRLTRNNTLWMSYVLQTPSVKIFIGGDSGYDTHFKKIGSVHGPFDLAILECGQYDKNWPYIHTQPEDTIHAAHDLQAKTIMPVHWGKFQLANHAWDEPVIRIHQLALENNIPLITPMIGEVVDLKNTEVVFSDWWKKIR
jgi:L-ascorbate metabolism protein UlaG (beta-lactamase superfamily)